MFKIVYVDESEADRYNFQDYVKYSVNSNDFKLEVIEPKADIIEFAQSIVLAHYKAVIIDFHLSEKNRFIHYDGADLAEEICKIRNNIPIFILTAYENDAVMRSDDVNWVYDKKSIVHKEDPLFLERIKQQIIKSEKRIEKAEIRLKELIEIRKDRTLDAIEEDEFIELDTLIEKSLSKVNQLPVQLKKQTNDIKLDKIMDLLDKVDSAIQKIKK